MLLGFWLTLAQEGLCETFSVRGYIYTRAMARPPLYATLALLPNKNRSMVRKRDINGRMPSLTLAKKRYIYYISAIYASLAYA